ncbi:MULTISPECIES: flavin reductase family protein [unclassified Mycolicibacterium]|uniref:flavin reductase family protein n=1 Tax=unclassified Mycolicibacterium TaxID=2636767 RepID=UPI002EDAB688
MKRDNRPPVTESTLRTVLGHFPTGVVIVTATLESDPVGMTLQSFLSLSITPPLALLSVAKTSTTWPQIATTRRFLVNILSEEQGPLARQFARTATDKFYGVDYTSDPALGGPLLAGTTAWVDCSIEAEHDGGDHTIVVARVLEASAPTSGGAAPAPLIFHRSGFPRLYADCRNQIERIPAQ